MSIHPSPDAIRTKLWRERRKKAIPPDIEAILRRGREDRQAIERHSRAISDLARLELAVAARLVKIQRAKDPRVRARRLGELADWIIERRAALMEVVESRPIRIRPMRPYSSPRQVPSWVPDDLRAVYLDPTISEFEAAALVRQMKRGSDA